MTKKQKSDDHPFFGEFIKCGKLVNGDWCASLVRITDIKSIHHDKDYTKNNGSIIHTSKDVWYVVDVDMYVIAEKVNKKLFNPSEYIAEQSKNI